MWDILGSYHSLESTLSSRPFPLAVIIIIIITVITLLLEVNGTLPYGCFLLTSELFHSFQVGRGQKGEYYKSKH
jgi:hypothetical protein